MSDFEPFDICKKSEAPKTRILKIEWDLFDRWGEGEERPSLPPPPWYLRTLFWLGDKYSSGLHKLGFSCRDRRKWIQFLFRLSIRPWGKYQKYYHQQLEKELLDFASQAISDEIDKEILHEMMTHHGPVAFSKNSPDGPYT